MVEKDSIMQFCLTCVEWADQVTNPSDRQIIVNVARSWLRTARLVDNQMLADYEARLNWAAGNFGNASASCAVASLASSVLPKTS
jgi:hypothetical protein